MLALWPLSENLAGVLGRYRSSRLVSTAPFFCGPLERSSCRFLTCSSRLVIFFWRERMDFHLSSSLLPSGSTSARLTLISYEKTYAVLGYSFLTRYSSISRLS